MCFRRAGKAGVTLLEILVVVAIIAIIAAVGLPALVNALQRARTRGTAEVLSTAMRDARSRAIATGWQFRVFGFNAAGGASANRFRIEGRSLTAPAPAWPASAVPGPLPPGPVSADPWVVLANDYKGVALNVGDPGSCPDPLGNPVNPPNSFCITYSPQGLLLIPISYQGPGGALLVTDVNGNVGKSVMATVAGAVRVQ